jgi:hypothetical protein
MENGKNEAAVDYFICKFKGRKNKMGKTTDFYLASNMEISGSKIRRLFRHRWKIETGQGDKEVEDKDDNKRSVDEGVLLCDCLYDVQHLDKDQVNITSKVPTE